MEIDYIDGKDCSEYAEDFIAVTGVGRLTSIIFLNDNVLVPFTHPNNLSGLDESYYYHTFVTSDNKVMDVTLFQGWLDLNFFINQIISNNPSLRKAKCYLIHDRVPTISMQADQISRYPHQEIQISLKTIEFN